MIDDRRRPGETDAETPDWLSFLTYHQSHRSCERWLTQLGNLGSRVAEDGNHPTRRLIGVDESAPIDMVVTFPANGEGGVGFLELERLRVPIAGDLGSKPVRGVQYPAVPRFAGKEHQFTDGDKASVAFGRPLLDVMHFPGKIEFLQSLSRPSGLDLFSPHVVFFPDFSKVRSNTKCSEPCL